MSLINQSINPNLISMCRASPECSAAAKMVGRMKALFEERINILLIDDELKLAILNKGRCYLLYPNLLNIMSGVSPDFFALNEERQIHDLASKVDPLPRCVFLDLFLTFLDYKQNSSFESWLQHPYLFSYDRNNFSERLFGISRSFFRGELILNERISELPPASGLFQSNPPSLYQQALQISRIIRRMFDVNFKSARFENVLTRMASNKTGKVGFYPLLMNLISKVSYSSSSLSVENQLEELMKQNDQEFNVFFLNLFLTFLDCKINNCLTDWELKPYIYLHQIEDVEKGLCKLAKIYFVNHNQLTLPATSPPQVGSLCSDEAKNMANLIRDVFIKNVRTIREAIGDSDLQPSKYNKIKITLKMRVFQDYARKLKLNCDSNQIIKIYVLNAEADSRLWPMFRDLLLSFFKDKEKWSDKSIDASKITIHAFTKERKEINEVCFYLMSDLFLCLPNRVEVQEIESENS